MKPAYECFANKRATGQTGSSMQVDRRETLTRYKATTNKDTNPLKLNMGINTSTSACIR